MKMFKKVFAVVLCVAMLASFAAVSASVSAEDAKTVVDGIRWFPCEPGRENDDMWEVECYADGCLCQRFDEDPEETGYYNYLDTTYGDDGSLTISRNGNDGKGELYWPRIRTLSLEVYPELDINTANTLYFDFEAVDCSWNMMLGFNGMTVKLSKVIADACGKTGVANSDADGAAGHYKGSINLQDALAAIAAEGTTESAAFATAISKMKTTFVPQLSIFYVGGTTGTITINEMFISTADDTTGANCDYLDMGLVMGDDYYSEDPSEGEDPTEGEDPSDVEDPADAVTTTTKNTAAVTTTTTAAADDAAAAGGIPGWFWWIVGAVVVIAGAVAAVIIIKKKKA